MDDGLNKQIKNDQNILKKKEKSEQIYQEVNQSLKTI